MKSSFKTAYKGFYWKRKHDAERKRIAQSGRCLCGAKLDEFNKVIDRGHQYGFECEVCR